MPETKTDLTDKNWDDLYNADYAVLRELAKEREGVRGDVSREEICAGLLAVEGRADEVPEEYEEHLPNQESDDGEEPDVGDESEGEEPDEQDGGEDEETEFESGSEYRDSSFIIMGGPLKTFLDHADALVDEAKIHLDPDGWKLTAVDPANVGMITESLDTDAFESYDTNGDLIGVNLTRLKEAIGGAKDNALVYIDVDGQARNVVIEYGSHEFTMALIDPDSIRQEPDLPDLDLPAKIEIERGLPTAISYADSVSDHTRITAVRDGKDDSLIISAEGDTDSYEYVATTDDAVFYAMPDGSAETLLSVDYLKDMVTTFDDADALTLRVGTEFPVEIHGEIYDDELQVGEVLYMLAPRIQSD